MLCQSGQWQEAENYWQNHFEFSQKPIIYWFAGLEIALQRYNQSNLSLVVDELIESVSDKSQLFGILQQLSIRYQYQQARKLLSYIAERQLYESAMLNDLGNLAIRLSEYDLASHFYNLMLDNPKTKPIAIYNFAVIERYKGNIAQCEQLLNDCIALQQNMVDAWYTLSHLKTWTDDDNHIDTLMQLSMDFSITGIAKAQIHYALAKELEDTEEYVDAFREMQRGGAKVKQLTNYDIQEDLAFLQAIKNTFGPIESEIADDLTCTPIFICGLPRTGSTLLERLLMAHSDIDSAGELNQFADLFIHQAQESFTQRSLSRPEMVSKSIELNLPELGERYLNSLDPQCTNKPYMIDKMPQNSVFVGLIRRALPAAKIILLERDHRDTCLAIYKQIFQGIYDFSYDLDDCGQYVAAMYDLMAHWQNSYPSHVHTVKYEELIENTEQVMTSIMEFLALPLQQACLSTQSSAAVSTTASATQVRQKIHSRSIGNWRKYAEQLVPLEQWLTDNNSTR